MRTHQLLLVLPALVVWTARPPQAAAERTWAKGRKGYLSVPNAWSFSFREPGRTVVVLHNPADQAAEVNLPVEVPAGRKPAIYRDNEGKAEKIEGGAIRAKLQPHQHLVAVRDGGPAR